MSYASAGGLTLILLAASIAAHADRVDDYIRGQMRRRGVPGLSLAIIQDGKIVKVKGYGVLEKGSTTPVTPSTMFQAASISKMLTAVAALKLVEQRKLSLDDDVNAKLLSWKVPENEFTTEKKVTLRGLLSHTAGLTVSGFPGYTRDESIPSLLQILNGEKPSNTPPIRVDAVPGSLWRYSGGGYVVLRQMLLDVTGKPFPQFLQETVLGPLGMKDSTFEQPLPDDKAKLTAAGTSSEGSAVKGRWHVYPEMAPDGLWTTPSDLARFAIAVQQSVAGKAHSLLSQEMARQMLTDQKYDVYQQGSKEFEGLGAFLQSSGSSLRFHHSGRNEGFDSELLAYAETGQGAVIMLNANENSGMINRILQVIAEAYHWPDYPRPSDVHRPPVVRMDAKALATYQGRYEFSNNNMMTLTVEQGKLVARKDGGYWDKFFPSGNGAFCGVDVPFQFFFARDARDEITHLSLKPLPGEKTTLATECPRIGPLIHTLTPQPDPDPALTKTVEAALKAFAQGGKAIDEIANITPGVRKDFYPGPVSSLTGILSISFVAAQDVTGRGIERHGGKVSRILYYKFVTDKATSYVLVYLTADGLITDQDVVDD